MKRSIFFSLMFTSMLAVSCETVKSEPKPSDTEVVAMVNDPETVLVDVRTPEEFAAESVPGAINIPLDKVEDSLDFFRKQKNVVLYCNSGRQSGLALKKLEKNGITNTYNATNVETLSKLQKGK